MNRQDRRSAAYDYDLASCLAAGRQARAEAFREAGRMIARAVRRLAAGVAAKPETRRGFAEPSR